MVYIHFGVLPLRMRLCRCRHTYTKMPGLQQGEWKEKSRKKKKKERNRICKLHYYLIRGQAFRACVCLLLQSGLILQVHWDLIYNSSVSILSIALFPLSQSLALSFMTPLLTADMHSGKARDRKAFFLDMCPTGAVREISKRISGLKNMVICV